MSITDELREWFKDRIFMANGWQEIRDIADRIDAEALSRRNEAYNVGYKAGIDMGFSSADDWLADHEYAMAERGWVKLPLDADGEYIHFGDVLDQFGTPMTVFAMSDPDPDEGDCMLELITNGISDSTWVRARKMRHYHAPTVEDVLDEFVERWHDTHHDDIPALLAEYAAKLRLAGDAE